MHAAPDQPASERSPSAQYDAGLELALTQGLAWSAVVFVVLGVLLWVAPGLSPAVAGALVAGAVPGLVAQILRWRDGERGRLVVIAAWAAGAGAAACLTGGVSGPLAIWCAAPLVWATGLDRKRSISAAGALSVAALALALWTSIAAWSLPPLPPAGSWLGALSVFTVTATVASTALSSIRRRASRVEALETTLRQAEALLSEQPQLMMTLDTAGQVVSAFGAAPAGVALDSLFVQGLIGAAHHPDRAPIQAALLQASTHGHAEVSFTPRSALDRHATLALRRLDDGRLIGVLRDSTLQHAREVALEARRQEAEALNAGKSRFLANMSHELRTPLNAVIGFSDIMRQRLFGPIPDRYAEYAQLIHESGGHLLDLISDVLDMSKIEAARYELHKETFDAREPVSAALRLMRLQAHEAEIAMRGVLPVESVTIEADRRALKQIALNLLSNALKFTPAGGSVTVALEARGDVLELTVSDTGVGVAPEDLKRLGRPFEQAGDAGSRAMGSGLGLSLVRAFAQLHGGDMAIESTLGEGTAVTVRLPVIVRENGGRLGAEIIPLDARR